MPLTNRKLCYRPEIDGLRAVAVVPVVFFHAGIEHFGGGFIGVDVFFVISGYLITGIILSEIGNGTFSILRFYQRRARRILPALFFVILCSIPAAWIMMPPLEHRDFAQSVVAASLFSSNFLFWKESGYFDVDSELKPLLHTWSLAVEEQYYMFFPILVLLLYRVGFTALWIGVLIIALISFGLSDWGARHAPSATFFLIHTRAWELFIGSLCALLSSRIEIKKSEGISMLGLAAIIIPVFVYDEHVPFPSAYALAPTLGTAAVILYARENTLVNKLLSVRIFVGIGLISYSAYLWHQPVLVFARIHEMSPLRVETVLALLLLSFVLAYFSWRFVERPFRRLRLRPSLLPASAMVSAAFAGFGVFVHVQGGIPDRFPPDVLAYFAAKQDVNPFQEKCFYGPGHAIPTAPRPDCVRRSDDLDVFVIGDSHASALAYAIRQTLEGTQFGFVEHTYSGCPAFPNFYRIGQEGYRRCHEFMTRALELARQDNALILLAARWTLYARGNGFDNGEGGVEMVEPGAVDVIGWTPDSGREDRVLRGYRESLLDILKNARVILVYPIPEAGWDVPYYTGKKLLNGENASLVTTSFKRYIERNAPVIDVFDSISHPNLYRVRPHEVLCDTFAERRCALVAGGRVLYFDDNHLNTVGAKLLAPAVMDHLLTITKKGGVKVHTAKAASSIDDSDCVGEGCTLLSP